MNSLIGVPILAALLLGGCAAGPRPRAQAADFDSPNLAISVRLFSPVGIFSFPPSVVYFARIDEEGGLIQQEVVASNYAKAGRFYALNVRPGTYVAVAAATNQGRSVYTTYFSTGIMEQTKVTVGDRDLAFMGGHWVYTVPGLWGADAAQKHYANVISPLYLKPGVLRALFSDTWYRGVKMRTRNDEKTRDAFFRAAKRDLDERAASVPRVPIADKFYWAGAEGNLGLEITGKFPTDERLRQAMRPDAEIGRFDGRIWTLRDILVSADMNAAGSSAVWRVSGPKPLIAAYAEGLSRRHEDSPLSAGVGFSVVNYKPAAD